MSDALTYLVKARPQEMAAYFTFLKGAGKHLDPKTRNLISVITKVHAQTENGLRQYLKRALREGATADEVVPALDTALTGSKGVIQVSQVTGQGNQSDNMVSLALAGAVTAYP